MVVTESLVLVRYPTGFFKKIATPKINMKNLDFVFSGSKTNKSTENKFKMIQKQF
jgi:hypothetical protein